MCAEEFLHHENTLNSAAGEGKELSNFKSLYFARFIYVKQRERDNVSRCCEDKLERFFRKDQNQDRIILF